MTTDFKATHVAVEWEHEEPLICCRFDPGGRYVFAGAEDYAIHRWALADGKKTTLTEHDCWIRAIAFAAGGELMISAGVDGQIVWWPTSAETPAPVRKVDAHRGWIRTLSVSPDGKLLASGGNDRMMKLFDAEQGGFIREFPGHESDIYSTFFHPNGKYLLSGTLHGKVRQFDLETGNVVHEFDASSLHTYNGGQRVHYGGVRTIDLSPDGKHLACGGLYKGTNPLGAVNEPLVEVYEWETQKKVHSHVAGDLKSIIWRVLYHDDGFLFAGAGGSGGGHLLFWKPDEDKVLHTVKFPQPARDMDLHPDGVQVVTVHSDKRVRISRLELKAG